VEAICARALEVGSGHGGVNRLARVDRGAEESTSAPGLADHPIGLSSRAGAYSLRLADGARSPRFSRIRRSQPAFRLTMTCGSQG
jgi:hypothetical protein